MDTPKLDEVLRRDLSLAVNVIPFWATATYAAQKELQKLKDENDRLQKQLSEERKKLEANNDLGRN